MLRILFAIIVVAFPIASWAADELPIPPVPPASAQQQNPKPTAQDYAIHSALESVKQMSASLVLREAQVMNLQAELKEVGQLLEQANQKARDDAALSGAALKQAWDEIAALKEAAKASATSDAK